METIAPFAAYVVALAIAAAIPGPGVAALVGRALAAGAGASLPFVLGLAVGDVVFLTMAILGLSALIAAASGALFVVKIAGGCYLIYLAARLWTAKAAPIATVADARRGAWPAALSGLAVTLGNPKTVVFYLALVPNVLDLDSVGLLDWLLLSLLTVMTLLVVLSPYAALAARLRSYLSSATALRRLNRAAAVLIGGAGGVILRDAVVGQTR